MFYAMKFGPIETEEGPCTAYVACNPASGFSQPVFVDGDAKGLRRLAAQAAPGQELLCEPQLVKAGRALGFVARPVPEDLLMPRALFALSLALGPQAGPPGAVQVLSELVRAAAAFWRAEPWNLWNDGQIIEVVVGARTYEAVVLGNAGQEYGLALYDGAGAVEEIARLVDAGKMRAAAKFDTLAVTYEDQPHFALDALQDAVGETGIPVPMRVRKGQPQAADASDLTILAAAVRAASKLSAECLQVEDEIIIGDARTVARVRAPEPEEWIPARTRVAVVDSFDVEQELFDDEDGLDDEAAEVYCSELVRRFEGSREDQRPSRWIDPLIMLGLEYCGISPARLTPSRLREILFGIFPRKLVCAPEDAQAIVDEVRAFLGFLEREFGLGNAAACAKILDTEAVEILAEELSDEENFGPAKAFFLEGKRRGFDLTTRAGINEWVATSNAEQAVLHRRSQAAAKRARRKRRKGQKTSRRKNR